MSLWGQGIGSYGSRGIMFGYEVDKAETVMVDTTVNLTGLDSCRRKKILGQPYKRLSRWGLLVVVRPKLNCRGHLGSRTD